jgi:DNA helicase II / ATP-dependent DNA helicase PcrA
LAVSPRVAFISYSHADMDFANRLHSDLVNASVDVWRDETETRAGDYLDSEIQSALQRKVTHGLVLLSPQSVQSKWVLDEIAFIQASTKVELIPLLIEPCIRPINVHRLKYISFIDRYDDALGELLERLFGGSEEVEEADFSQLIDAPPPKFYTLTSEQVGAAQDERSQVRLIAGPGTGKSLVIEERVRWLLSQNVDPEDIAVVSFTRASSRDLKNRIEAYCKKYALPSVTDVSVTTLHSLALTALKKSGALSSQVDLLVLDDWECDQIFDLEFSLFLFEKYPHLPLKTSSRCEAIRLKFEAMCQTGSQLPPEYRQPDPPISDEEMDAFRAFHISTTQTYFCVLPGEIVKKCVDMVELGFLDPAPTLKKRHLIVDEFQDLNPIDLKFVDAFTSGGAITFVAGDDDQSIYSFRYANPAGIQHYLVKYPEAGDHRLNECFRCTPAILDTSRTLMKMFPGETRISKTLFSRYENTTPKISGSVHRWIFKSAKAELSAIARSCRNLIDAGMKPRDIMVLLSAKDEVISPRKDDLSELEKRFAQAGVEVDMPRGTRFIDTEVGRLAYAILRIAADLKLTDYIAHRTLLGLLVGVGQKTRYSIRRKVTDKILNYIELFYNPLPEGVFTGGEIKALTKARELCELISGWSGKDTLIARKDEICELIRRARSKNDAPEDLPLLWLDAIASLPDEMNLEETKAYLSSDNVEEQYPILQKVYERLKLPIPEEGLVPQKVRIMTMHGVKGLDASVVFVPGLEEAILPGSKREPYAGLVLEGARMVYVSTTRARCACIFSLSASRWVWNRMDWNRRPSRYTAALNGKFEQREDGLSSTEIAQIYNDHMRISKTTE